MQGSLRAPVLIELLLKIHLQSTWAEQKESQSNESVRVIGLFVIPMAPSSPEAKAEQMQFVMPSDYTNSGQLKNRSTSIIPIAVTKLYNAISLGTTKAASSRTLPIDFTVRAKRTTVHELPGPSRNASTPTTSTPEKIPCSKP